MAFFAEGVYVCRIKSQELSTSSNGNLQLMISFAVLGVPDPANADNYLRVEHGRFEQTRRLWLTFTDKSMEFALEHLSALGWHGESVMELDARKAGFHSFRDQVVDLYCKHEGEAPVRERWQVSVRKPNAIREEKVKEVDQLLLQHRKGVKGPAA